jgi:hypothetical protein
MVRNYLRDRAVFAGRQSFYFARISYTSHPATGSAPSEESLFFQEAGRPDRSARGACRQAEASPTNDMYCRRSDHRSSRPPKLPGRLGTSPTRSFGRNPADASEGLSSTRPSRRPDCWQLKISSTRSRMAQFPSTGEARAGAEPATNSITIAARTTNPPARLLIVAPVKDPVSRSASTHARA